MTNEATIARDNASHCEAIKYALRQSKDGVVVSFVLHPNDIPSTVQLAPIGSRFVLAFVEIGDDEKPKEVMPTDGKSVPPDKSPAPTADNAPVRAREWKEIPYSQQAGILCSDPKFGKFLDEKFPDKCAYSADITVRWHCQVQSRSEIRPGTKAEQRWNLLVSAYRAWEMAPSVGAA